MKPEMETQATQAGKGWADKDGFVGPFKPGSGPRSDPRGEFPTGPEVGERLPDVLCKTIDSTEFDLHQDRGERPAVLIFFRSAVW
jgi:hypothetical protein